MRWLIAFSGLHAVFFHEKIDMDIPNMMFWEEGYPLPNILKQRCHPVTLPVSGFHPTIGPSGTIMQMCGDRGTWILHDISCRFMACRGISFGFLWIQFVVA